MNVHFNCLEYLIADSRKDATVKSHMEESSGLRNCHFNTQKYKILSSQGRSSRFFHVRGTQCNYDKHSNQGV